MDLTLLTLLSFAGLAATVAAGGLFMRDLVFGGPRVSKTLVKRLPLARDTVAPTGPVSSLDYKLNRFVLETGIDTTPWATFLLLFCCGLLAGGCTFLYTNDELLASVAFIVGAMIPLPYLAYRRRKYLGLINEQLPDALDLLSRALRAGESLDQSIELAGEKGSEPLAKEFRRCARHLQMGLSLPAAMRALVNRLPLTDVKIFATTLSVYRQAGGSLSSTLERMASVVRERTAFRRQVRATTAAGRFSAALISAIGPLLFLYMFLFQREYAIKLISLPLGQMLIITAVVLEVIGLVWIARLMRTAD